MSQKSILEVAVDPSYAFFFQRAYKKRLIWRPNMFLIAAGCILILQAAAQVSNSKPASGFCVDIYRWLLDNVFWGLLIIFSEFFSINSI
jgi:hypothetical protein